MNTVRRLPRDASLDDWLAWIERLHPRRIEMGLGRVQRVLDALELRDPPYSIIAVGGTNGKGSTVAIGDAILRAAGYRVGAYTSPHLIRYNDRIRVNGTPVADDALRASFERIDAARGETPLTYFEFGTIAALELFRRGGVDIAVLEVGMGGRLDAVNAVDADAAIVTTVGIDHVAWLGSDRESIGREKAGIFRAGKPAVCGDPAPPASLIEVAQRSGAKLYRLNRDFSIERQENGWVFSSDAGVRAALPYPALRGARQLYNAAAAIKGIESLGETIPVSQSQIREGLINVRLAGRFQVIPGAPTLVLDVAHNVEAAETLAANLREQKITGRTLAVFGMLIDKDIAGAARALAPLVDRWYLASLQAERAATASELASAMQATGGSVEAHGYASAREAFGEARRAAAPNDRIVVFGSFYLVGDILSALETDRGGLA